MTEERSLTVTEFAQELLSAIDELLATGDWSSSLFLKTTANKLQHTHCELVELLTHEQPTTESALTSNPHPAVAAATNTTTIKVFVLLYLVNNTDLASWQQAIKALLQYNTNRSAYKEERQAQAAIKMKTSGLEHNGYLVFQVQESAVIATTTPMKDPLGATLFTINGANLTVENLQRFVHANHQHYQLREDQLIVIPPG